MSQDSALVVWCDRLWYNRGNGVCPNYSVCVPAKTIHGLGPNNERGFCSCEFYGTALVDHLTRNATGGAVLECEASTASWCFFPVLVTISLVSLAVAIRLTGTLRTARDARDFRWDVMNKSAVFMILGCLSLAISRLNHALAEIGLLHTTDAKYATFEAVESATLVGLAIFGVGGALYFGIATLMLMADSARLASRQSGNSIQRAKMFALVGGILAAIAMVIVFQLGLYFLAGLVEAVGCVVLFVIFSLLGRTLTQLSQAHNSHTGKSLPTFAIVVVLARRIHVALAVLLLAAIAVVACTYIGRDTVDRKLLGNTMVALSIVEYACTLGALGAIAVALDAVTKFKVGRSLRANSATSQGRTKSVGDAQPSTSISAVVMFGQQKTGGGDA